LNYKERVPGIGGAKKPFFPLSNLGEQRHKYSLSSSKNMNGHFFLGAVNPVKAGKLTAVIWQQAHQSNPPLPEYIPDKGGTELSQLIAHCRNRKGNRSIHLGFKRVSGWAF
ncbi:MAG: hypothetical protein ACLFT8_03340, partial [Desulfovermiculus sp.]